MNDDLPDSAAPFKEDRLPAPRSSPWSTLGVVLCLLVVGAVIFRDFLFGGAVLLYKDSGGDSVNSTYPWFVHLSRYLRTEGLPSWSFCVGMGQDIFPFLGTVLLEPVVWLSKELIAPGLVYQHLLKVVLAGLLFFRFLRLRHSSLPAAMLGALLLSFSSYMCMGACWPILADEALCFAALLVALEAALQRGRWLLLPFAVALVGLMGAFHLYVTALFLVLYVPARLFQRHGWEPGIILRRGLPLAVAAVLGVTLGAVVVYPNLQAMLNSPRGSGTTSLASLLGGFPVFGFESSLHYITAVMRPFANDILGTADGFRGWQNYLEGPLSYCGLICLVLFPQAFVGATRREKILYSLFAAGILLSTVFPWFRYLFWAFQGDYYRTLSLFSILGLIALSAAALSRYGQGRFNFWLLLPTILVLVGTLYLPLDEMQRLLDPNLKLRAVILLLSYGAVLALGHLLRRPRAFAWIIVAVTIGELVLFDSITVSGRRTTVSKEELKARVGYNDLTVDVVNELKAADPTSFFRLTKTYSSSPALLRGLNDAMVFGYYSTSSYNPFPHLNYINFLTAVNIIPPNSEIDTRWTDGLTNDSLLSLFAGEKYVLAHNPLPYQRAVQYEFAQDYGNAFLFRNARFLPLGLAFDRFITEDVFSHLHPTEKPGVLLQAVVLSNDDRDKYGLAPANIYDLTDAARNLDLLALATKHRETGLRLTSFRQSHFAGKIALPQKSVLVIQTPFDPGWHAWQDGQAARVLKVDVGLLGVALDAGEHQIELSYRTPFLGTALAISLISLALLGLGIWRFPRLKIAEEN